MSSDGTSPTAPTDDAEPPVLGEPLAVELANSRYGFAPRTFDHLGDGGRTAAWLAELADHHHVDPADVDALTTGDDELVELRSLRDAVRSLVESVADGATPDSEVIETINRSAAEGRIIPSLGWIDDGFAADVTVAGQAGARFRCEAAMAAIELVTGADAERIRRCARPGCSLLFVQHHRHRRYCHESCSHAARQERYRDRRR